MAILFVEPKSSLNEPSVDQVDGPIHHTTTNQASNSGPNNMGSAVPHHNSTTANSSDPAELPWKLLALAICKVLKTYYQQAGNMGNFGSAIIEILPGTSTPTE